MGGMHVPLVSQSINSIKCVFTAPQCATSALNVHITEYSRRVFCVRLQQQQQYRQSVSSGAFRVITVFNNLLICGVSAK